MVKSTTTLTLVGTLLLVGVCRSDDKPNLIVINVDDLGWNDVDYLPERKSPYHTPNIKKLADDGMVFTDGYAACPVCSPTRASLATGRTTAALKLTAHIPGKPGADERRKPADARVDAALSLPHLPLEEVTFAEVLKKNGYRTGFIGKWHLAGEGSVKEKQKNGLVAPQFHPEKQGFDVNIGGCAYGQPRSYFDPYFNGAIKDRNEGEYLTDRLADEAADFVATSSEVPFLLYLNPYSVHTPLDAPEARKALIQNQLGVKGKPLTYAAMIYSVDLMVGKVVEAVQREGVEDRTMILFTSDNGGYFDNSPLHENKGTLWEGGIRVPYIVKWPGRVKPGSVCSEPIISYDVFPTLLSAAECLRDLPEVVEGSDMIPLLTGQGTFRRNEPLLWHYPHYHHGGMDSLDMGSAIRSDDWKFIHSHKTGKDYLFNLKKDLSENNNLASTMPAKTREMKTLLFSRLQGVGANMPTRLQVVPWSSARVNVPDHLAAKQADRLE